MESKPIIRHTTISENIVAFCRYLRTQHFLIGANEESEALFALRIVRLDAPEMMRNVLKAILVKNLTQWERFDRLYHQYWDEVEKGIDSKIKQDEQNAPTKPHQNSNNPSFAALKNWLYGNKSEEMEEIASYSPIESLEKKDFIALTEEDVKQISQWLKRFAPKILQRNTRRFEKTHQKTSLNIRHTIRANLRTGGEIIRLNYKRPKKQKLRLVLICDVSKSMDLYSRFLIQMLYAFQNSTHPIETFVFSTTLQRITDELKENKVEDVLNKLAEKMPYWSGGTKIGASLELFCKEYAHRLVDKKTTVVILSDGWDTGDLEILEKSVQEIRKSSALLVWLNPLAGNPTYKPTVEGMQKVMPYVDIFAPIHNLESLKNLLLILRKGKRKEILMEIS